MNLKSKEDIMKYYFSRRDSLYDELEKTKSKKQRGIIYGKIYEIDDFVKNILE